MSRPIPELDESLQQLEEELRAMTPAATSDGLRERIRLALLSQGAEFSPAGQGSGGNSPAESLRPPGRVWFGWVPVAAAAAVALMAVVLFPPSNSRTSGFNPALTATRDAAQTGAPAASESIAASEVTPVDWQPLTANSRLERVAYEGIRQEDTSTYRQIRSRYLERRTFRNPEDGSTVEVMLPREEIRLVPVVPE